MQLKGSVAMVTGGASGIGKAICEKLLQSGVKVCIADIDTANGTSTAATLSDKYGADHVMFVSCDVTSRENIAGAMDKTIQRFSGLNILCNNAGWFTESSDFERIIQVNLAGTIHGCQLALERMGRQNGGGGGVIINTSSIGGCYPFKNLPAYGSTKAGINMYTRAMAELMTKKQGVRFCAVCPSLTATPANAKAIAESYEKEEFDKSVDSMIYMKPAEVADAVLGLITDDSKNGTLLLTYPAGPEEFKSPQLDMSKVLK